MPYSAEQLERTDDESREMTCGAFLGLHLSISRSSKTQILCAKGRVIPTSTPSTLMLPGGQIRHWIHCWRVEPTTIGMVTGCCQGCGVDFFPVTKTSKGLRVVRVDIVQSSGTMQARLFNDQKCGQVCKKGIRNKERRHLATDKPKLDKARTLTIRLTHPRWIHTSATLSGCLTKTIASRVNRHHVVHRMRITHTQNFRK